MPATPVWPEVTRKLHVLHLFSGPRREGDLEWYFRELGSKAGYDVEVISIDTLHPNLRYENNNDVVSSKLRIHILSDVRAGYFDIVHAGTPCSTWSAARHRPLPSGNVYPLRDNDDPFSKRLCRSPRDRNTMSIHDTYFEFTSQVF